MLGAIAGFIYLVLELFSLGMPGTWYRAGEGLLGWVALFFYGSAAAMKSGFLVPLNQLIAKLMGTMI